MTERQLYYKQLVGHLVEKYYGIEIDPTTDTESPLPNVRMDMFFEIPKTVLTKASSISPFPFMAEVNIVHIKAVNDKLTKGDIVQYLGELYVIAQSNIAKDKSIALTIITAEEINKAIEASLYARIEKTSIPWIDKIGAEAPAYLFVLERLLPDNDKYWYFLPFQPIKILESNIQRIRQIIQQACTNKEYALFLFWLSKLQPEFYAKEIGMSLINLEEVAKELYPQAWKQLEEAKRNTEKAKADAKREVLIKILHSRFSKIPKTLQEKIDKLDSVETLDSIIDKALQCTSIEDLKTLLR